MQQTTHDLKTANRDANRLPATRSDVLDVYREIGVMDGFSLETWLDLIAQQHAQEPLQ